MIVSVKWSALKQTHGYEYIVRFALGGLATVLAGVIADRFGPVTGGLFLAFPAIFCASATLVEKHERDRKIQKGMRGEERGRRAAALDAAGAGWGSLALAAFAVVIWKVAPSGAASSLAPASVVWLSVAVGLFFLRRKADDWAECSPKLLAGGQVRFRTVWDQTPHGVHTVICHSHFSTRLFLVRGGIPIPF